MMQAIELIASLRALAPAARNLSADSRQIEAGDDFLHPTVQAPDIMHLQFVRQARQFRHRFRFATRRRMRSGVIGAEQTMCRPGASGNRLEHRVSVGEYGLPCNKRHTQIRHAPDHAVIGVNIACNHLEQAGLAGAIAADQANAFGFFDDQRSAIEQWPMTKGERNVIEREIGHAGWLNTGKCRRARKTGGQGRPREKSTA